MIVQADWLTRPATQALCAALEAAGFHPHFVGGCVRDGIIGRAVTDIDIATDARPEQVMQIAAAADMKPIPTGIDHGTVTVVVAGYPHEVTTFRRDVQTDGRRATVAFSTQVEEDALRRDFTINALYADARGVVSDPLGSGLADLQARRVRFIGDPHDRIAEDYLRILRFFRFHAHYAAASGGPDADGLAACAEMADGIDRLSRERVGAEMVKLLAAPDPGPAMAAMVQAGVLARVLPGADATALPVLIHHEAAAGLASDPVRRLALLGGQDVTDALRLSKAQASAIANRRKRIGDVAGPGALGYFMGAQAGRDVVLLRAVLFEIGATKADLAAVARGAQQVCPLRAADLQSLGLSGPDIGIALRKAEARWIASDFSLTKADLLA
jgi:poly(A) polymerase